MQLSAAENAYRHVKEQILRGDLTGGTMVSEGEIAADLGVSRTPVREAFLRLEAEGWLRLFPKRGALVVPVAPGEAEAVLDARLLLEGHGGDAIVAAPAAERERTIRDLRETVTSQAEAVARGDIVTYSYLDTTFHQHLTDAAGNPLLSTFAVTLRERQHRMIAHLQVSIAEAEAFTADHRLLVDHLERGEGLSFRLALSDHLARAYPAARALR